MGWLLIRDPKTGKTELLGEPELMRSQPPEELGEEVYRAWKSNHSRFTSGGENDS